MGEGNDQKEANDVHGRRCGGGRLERGDGPSLSARILVLWWRLSAKHAARLFKPGFRGGDRLWGWRDERRSDRLKCRRAGRRGSRWNTWHRYRHRFWHSFRHRRYAGTASAAITANLPAWIYELQRQLLSSPIGDPAREGSNLKSRPFSSA